MDDAKLRVVVTYIWDNVAAGEFKANAVNKNIVNNCGRIIMDSCRLVNYWNYNQLSRISTTLSGGSMNHKLDIPNYAPVMENRGVERGFKLPPS